MVNKNPSFYWTSIKCYQVFWYFFFYKRNTCEFLIGTSFTLFFNSTWTFILQIYRVRAEVLAGCPTLWACRVVLWCPWRFRHVVRSCRSTDWRESAPAAWLCDTDCRGLMVSAREESGGARSPARPLHHRSERSTRPVMVNFMAICSPPPCALPRRHCILHCSLSMQQSHSHLHIIAQAAPDRLLTECS